MAAAYRIVQGYGGGVSKPYLEISRAQVITMVVRAAERIKPTAVPKPRAGWRGVVLATDPTHGANIARAEYAGLLAGIDPNTFTPYGKATRGEVAQIVWNLTQK